MGIWFTDQTGSGNAWGHVESDGIHSKNGLTTGTVYFPSGFDSDGKPTGWWTGTIVDGIVK